MGWSALPFTIVCGQLGYNLGVLGRVDEAKDYFFCGFTPELEQVCNLTTKMAYCSWQGLFISLIGEDPFDASARLDQLIELAERSDSPFLILVFGVAKANVLIGIGDFNSVLKIGEKTLKAIEGKSIQTGHVINLHYDLVLAAFESGDQESAWRYYEDGLSLVKLAPHWWEPRFNFLKALLSGADSADDLSNLKGYFESSIEADEMLGAVVPAAQTRYHFARFLYQNGKINQSHQILKDLHDQFENWNISAWKEKCSEALKAF
jgi:hypothetical protein